MTLLLVLYKWMVSIQQEVNRRLIGRGLEMILFTGDTGLVAELVSLVEYMKKIIVSACG